MDNTRHKKVLQKKTKIKIKLKPQKHPKIKIKLKPQKHFCPWITLGIKKSSERKQTPYEKFLKTRNAKSEAESKAYKNMFEIIKC